MRAAAVPTLPSLEAGSRPLIRLLSPPLLLVLAMVGMVIAVPPLGEFPINDDWAHALAVRSLVEQGRLEVPAWTAPSMVLQAYWGALFAWLFGLSHTVLRASTLVLGGVAVLGLYLLLSDLLDARRALLGALFLLFNPLYVFLAYSFETEVPFLAPAIWALLCYVRALRGPRPQVGWLAAGSALAGGAFLVRQLGVALLPVALASLLLVYGWRATLQPRQLAAACLPFVPAVLLGTYFQVQRGPVGHEPVAWTLAFWAKHGPGLVGVVATRSAESFATLGLFTFPLLIGTLGQRSIFAPGRRWYWLAGLLLALLVGAWVRGTVFRRDPLFPFVKNTLTQRGFLGNDAYNNTLPPLLAPEAVFAAATVIAVLGAGLLALVLVRALTAETVRGPASAPLLFGLAALGFSVLFHEFFDRYLLVMLPAALLLALLSFRWSAWQGGLALVGVVALIAWSIAWEREYLERRSALWRAGLALVERGIAPDEIDGGFEWNGWYRGPAVLADAARQGKNTGRGSELRNFLLKGLDMSDARWTVAYARRGEPVGSRILASVTYGPGQRAVGIQRF